MGKLPKISYTEALRKTYQVQFGGLNHNIGASDGEIYDMKNMASDHYPVISPRDKRKLIETLNGTVGGMISYGGAIVYIEEGKKVYLRTKYGYTHIVGTVSVGEKTFATYQNKVIIFPDKIYVNVDALGEFLTLADLQLSVKEPAYGDVYAVGAGIPADLYYYDGSEWQFLEKESGSLEASFTTRVSFIYDGSLYGEPAEANTLYGVNGSWEYNGFKVGDAVEISGCVDMPANNKTPIIREIDGDYLRFYENVFSFPPTKYTYTATKKLIAEYEQLATLLFYGFKTDEYEVVFQLPKDALIGSTFEWAVGSATITFRPMNDSGWFDDPVEIQLETDYTYEDVNRPLEFIVGYGDYTESRPVTLSRKIPDMEFVISDDNRLWGAKGNTIYGSKLGDPTNFNVFDGLSTDSFSVDIGNAGDITAALTYNGYPTFFKEDGIFRLYGDKPSNFQIIPTMKQGVKAGCAKSLAIAGEVLYYIGLNGIMAYTGGVPTKIDESLGLRIIDGVAVGDGIKYYISATGLDDDGNEHTYLYVYDTSKRMWHKEDDLHLTYAAYDKAVLGLDKDGKLWALTHGEVGTDEEDVEWNVEFADMVFGSPFQKGIVKVNIRFDLEADATAKAEIQYNSSGEWEEIRAFTGNGKRSNVLPVIPRRCDHFRLRLSGKGVCDIYSLAVQYYQGSEIY